MSTTRAQDRVSTSGATTVSHAGDNFELASPCADLEDAATLPPPDPIQPSKVEELAILAGKLLQDYKYMAREFGNDIGGDEYMDSCRRIAKLSHGEYSDRVGVLSAQVKERLEDAFQMRNAREHPEWIKGVQLDRERYFELFNEYNEERNKAAAKCRLLEKTNRVGGKLYQYRNSFKGYQVIGNQKSLEGQRQEAKQKPTVERDEVKAIGKAVAEQIQAKGKENAVTEEQAGNVDDFNDVSNIDSEIDEFDEESESDQDTLFVSAERPKKMRKVTPLKKISGTNVSFLMLGIEANVLPQPPTPMDTAKKHLRRVFLDSDDEYENEDIAPVSKPLKIPLQTTLPSSSGYFPDSIVSDRGEQGVSNMLMNIVDLDDDTELDTNILGTNFYVPEKCDNSFSPTARGSQTPTINHTAVSTSASTSTLSNSRPPPSNAAAQVPTQVIAEANSSRNHPPLSALTVESKTGALLDKDLFGRPSPLDDDDDGDFLRITNPPLSHSDILRISKLKHQPQQAATLANLSATKAGAGAAQYPLPNHEISQVVPPQNIAGKNNLASAKGAGKKVGTISSATQNLGSLAVKRRQPAPNTNRSKGVETTPSSPKDQSSRFSASQSNSLRYKPYATIVPQHIPMAHASPSSLHPATNPQNSPEQAHTNRSKKSKPTPTLDNPTSRPTSRKRKRRVKSQEEKDNIAWLKSSQEDDARAEALAAGKKRSSQGNPLPMPEPKRSRTGVIVGGGGVFTLDAQRTVNANDDAFAYADIVPGSADWSLRGLQQRVDGPVGGAGGAGVVRESASRLPKIGGNAKKRSSEVQGPHESSSRVNRQSYRPATETPSRQHSESSSLTTMNTPKSTKSETLNHQPPRASSSGSRISNTNSRESKGSRSTQAELDKQAQIRALEEQLAELRRTLYD